VLSQGGQKTSTFEWKSNFVFFTYTSALSTFYGALVTKTIHCVSSARSLALSLEGESWNGWERRERSCERKTKEILLVLWRDKKKERADCFSYFYGIKTSGGEIKEEK
jgi:hypothetical protein